MLAPPLVIALLSAHPAFGLDAALSTKRITLHVQGAGATRVSLTLRAAEPTELSIPAGTYFEGGARASMVVLEGQTVALAAGETKLLSLVSACANFHKPVPGEKDVLTLGKATPELERRARCLEKEGGRPGPRQLAIFETTDGPGNYDLLARSEMIDALMVDRCVAAGVGLSTARCTGLVAATRKAVIDPMIADARSLSDRCR